MANVVITNQESPKYSVNLYPYESALNGSVSITENEFGVAELDASVKYNRLNSIRAIITSNVSTFVFNIGDALTFTAPETGTYIFSFRLFMSSDYSANSLTGRFTMFQKAVGTDFGFDKTDFGFEYDKWNTFTQTVFLEAGDLIENEFKLNSDTVGTRVYIGGIKAEFDDRNLGLPSRYSEPFNDELTTGFQVRVDTINTQAITNSIENTVSFTGTLEENGGLTLMDTNAKIIPISINDCVTVDFSCTFITPAGADRYAVVTLFVDGQPYRSTTHQLIKGSGNDDPFSISWSLNVGSLFLANGGFIKINPSADCSIKNRYLKVERTHKGV
jgi:hypothetical protein